MQPVEEYYRSPGSNDRVPDQNDQWSFNPDRFFLDAPAPDSAPLQVDYLQPLTAKVTDPLSNVNGDQASVMQANVTQVLPFNASPNVTRNLPEVAGGTFGGPQRRQMVIPGNGVRRKQLRDRRPPQGRRWVVQTAVMLMVVVMGMSALLTVLPIDTLHVAGFTSGSAINMVKAATGNNDGISLQQAATATAVTQDGYDPGTGQTFAGLPTPPPYTGGGASTLGEFSYGQCTYWADLRYHQLTGIWVPNFGNAANWYYEALNTPGWHVSSIPRLYSIMVLQPYTEQATGYGHVAIVESILSSTSFDTSNYNWFQNGGGWNTYSRAVFYTGPGVSFIWHD